MRNLSQSLCASFASFSIFRLLAKKAIVMNLLFSLLVPTLVLGNVQNVFAAVSLPSLPSLPALPTFDAPDRSTFAPEPMVLSSETVTPPIISSTINSVQNFFTTPQLPEGFEIAKPVSQFKSLINSVGTTLGFFAVSSSTNAANASSLMLPQPAGSVKFDFDGDNKADISRWRASTNSWQVKQSSDGNLTNLTIGSASAVAVPGDFDGDGKTDRAVFNAGTWTIKRSSDGVSYTVSFGTSGDKPVTGDYDGDGKSDPAIFRPSTNTWWILYSNGSGYTSTAFGNAGDITAQGNYDGDNKTDIAVFRPSTGDWHIQGSSAGYTLLHWGIASDIPTPADYDGDGKTDYGVYRASTGTWYIYYSDPNKPYSTITWGNFGDQPTPADYDGDGKADLTVWRPTTATWYSIKSSDQSYSYQTLGATGDMAVPSAYLKQIGGQVVPSDLAKTRLSPKNSTGGTDLYARNFGWSAGLVALSGRAGLDAGFGISYNSLVWTRQGNTMFFDADASNVTPGFRFGFSNIEPAYYDAQTGRFAYLMVTPSGARVEFKQTAASDVYETADSSYTQLKVNVPEGSRDASLEDMILTVTGTDGSAMSYNWKAGAYRPFKIRDANGNFINIEYDERGLLRTVTDTLGRIVTVNYDSQFLPTTITQTWENGTHTYATFSYTNQTIVTNFATNLTIYGPGNNTSVRVLDKITFADTSFVKFDYNSYAQVKQINNHAPNGQKLNHVAVTYDIPTQPNLYLSDCPRFGETKSYVKDFNNGAEVVVPNTFSENATYNVPGASGTATLIQVTAPDGTISRTYVGSSGWQEGLPIATEDLINEGGLQRKRWTYRQYTQDDVNLPYILNPRVTETKVGDETNAKRTEIVYNAQFGLVDEVKLYNGTTNALLKRATTAYNFSTDYISRRIIGLPAEQKLFDGNNALMSRVTYNYDGGNFSATEQNVAAVQHDNTAFGANFIIGRGNLTSVTRWDVNSPEDTQAAVTSQTKYNTAGAPVAQIDAVGREVKISYADAFSDGQNRNTFAYPTKLTDPAENFSEVKYRYDIGANVWAKSPAPNAQTPPKISTRTFDGIGRIEKQKIENNGAYTRYEYQPDNASIKVFTTVTDSNNDGQINQTDEVTAESFFDGAGRTLKSRSPMTFDASGNTTSWVGQKAEYDILGRIKKQTTPTEINASWNPTGDDLTRGWQWTSKEYDWKGRVTREIGLDNVDRVYSYDGCGCAGGEVTTVKGELVNGERRTQKLYADILGRIERTEVLDYEDNVYTTAVTEYNGRDQATAIRQYEGAAGSQTFQEVLMTYDGHGRLQTRHTPEQQFDKATVYSYFKDDRQQKVTDGRGASSTFIYNNRGLAERIDYSLPGAAGNFPTINANSNGASPQPCGPEHPNFPDCEIEPNPTPTPNPQPYLSWVTFDYDALGNRTNMTDSETGTTSYEYDQLSRMTFERKQFRADWTQVSNRTFDIGYTYDLAGGLKSITDPYGATINYKTDKLGRLEQVTGTPFGASGSSVTNYINDIEYRAWGAVKKIDYGNNVQMTQDFDSRLRVSEFKVRTAGDYPATVRKNYEYYDDNRLKFTNDSAVEYLKSDDTFDRSFEYDFMGRLTKARSGTETAGGTAADRNQIPYRQDYAYNAFGNVTSRQTYTWTEADNKTHQWTNNRESTWSYDADGRLKQTPQNRYYYDATGAVLMVTLDNVRRTIRHLDGEGKAARTNNYSCYSGQCNLTDTEYLIYSSVLGKVLTEVKADGTKKKTNVYGTGGIVATQNIEGTTSAQVVRFEHLDPLNQSYVETASNGQMWYLESPAELDPVGSNVGLYNPNQQQLQSAGGNTRWGDPFGGFSCKIDWMDAPCSQAMGLLSSGIGVIGPLDQFRHDGGGWGRFECPGGILACGYYYDYDYEFPDPNSDDGIGLGKNIYFHPAETDSGPFYFDLNQQDSNPLIIENENTPTANPCAGNTLDYFGRGDVGWRHIVPRHIDQDPDFTGKSQYGWGFLSTPNLDARKSRTAAINNLTFKFGGVTVTTNRRGQKTYVYVLAIDANLFDSIEAFAVGTDEDHNYDYTNVNTLIIGEDCKTVITSYPGLPRTPSNPNIVGTPKWWTPTFVLPL